MKYKVVKDAKLEIFVDFINSLIKEGWKPLGGVSAAGGDGFGETIYFIQALIKE